MQSAVMLHSPECPGRSSLDSIPVRRLRTRRIQRPKRKDSNQTPIYQFHNGEEARQNRCRHGRKERQKCVLLSDKVREKVQKGNLYFFDNGPDCESEGFIRFRDRKADKAGLLNSEGEIAIPPVYNDLTNVRNGLVIALMGAKKNF